MPKTANRTYHHGNLREAVLVAAEQALETSGIGSVSLREICRELDVSHTAPRRHFPTKQALLVALAIHGYELLGAELERAVDSGDGDFDRRLRDATRTLVRFAIERPALMGHMFATKHQPDAPVELLAASTAALAPGPRLIAEGQAAGRVVEGDPALLTMIPFAATQGLVLVSTRGVFMDRPVETLVDDMTQQIILGLRPRS